MKNYIKYFIFLFIILFAATTSVSAATLKNGEQIVLPKDAIIEDDYFAAGESVTVAGTVAGDAYVAGGMVNIEGTIQGDLLVAGGTVTIRGTVEDDVRAVGGEVMVSGVIKGNLTAAGGTVTVSDGAQIAGNVVSGAGNMNIYAPLAKNIVAGAGQLTIANTVAGDVTAGVGELTLSPNAIVEGDLTYYSEEPVTVTDGAVVSGAVKYQEIQKPDREKTEKMIEQGKNGFISIARIFNILSAFILGALALRFFPQSTLLVHDQIVKRPWASMGIGLVALIVAPILMVIFFATIIGIPLALLLMFGYFFYMYISKIFVSLVIGNTTLGYFKSKQSKYISLLIGLIIYLVITSIPVVGGFIVFISLLIGLGAILIAKREYYKILVTKKVI